VPCAQIGTASRRTVVFVGQNRSRSNDKPVKMSNPASLLPAKRSARRFGQAS
jgi:hypothetical protein